MDVTFRPIDQWPGELTLRRTASPFQVGLPETERLLKYEVGRLDGKLLVVQLAIEETDLKVDGRPKIRAEYKYPGVIVSFESRHGPLRYATDTFDRWPANLRAIALGLEALRRVDRYGITRQGEQYTGWKQLEGGTGQITAREEAARFLSEHASEAVSPDALPERVRRAYRRAAPYLHPDAGGDPEDFRKLQQARDILLGEEG